MVKGSCLCGSVQFEIFEFCSGIYKCHCSLCRKTFGGASSAVALAPDNSFRWLQGQESVSRFERHAGYSSNFCSRCGSVVPMHLADNGVYWVPVGLLDGDPGIKLTRHVHLASKAPWEIPDSETEHLQQGFEF